MLKIESSKAKIEFETLGAQMISFQLLNRNFEYLWQPQENFWQGRNPILFPLVGSTADKCLHIEGKTYPINNHGFARNAIFEVAAHCEDEITFELNASDATRLVYPYEFKLSVNYKLVGAKVKITYEIHNLSNGMMPFTFGLHPAFTCPLSLEGRLEDNYLEFSNAEYNSKLQSDLQLKDDKIIELSEELFERIPTVMFEHCASSHIKLTDGHHMVNVSCIGYRWLAFWKTKDSKFLCIEPWHSHADFDGVIREFKDRPGMIHLEPKRSYTTAYEIEIA